MKKVLISIIIILTILLIGQGIYYSLDIKEENINESRENSISNTMRIFNDVNTVEKIEWYRYNICESPLGNFDIFRAYHFLKLWIKSIFKEIPS